MVLLPQEAAALPLALQVADEVLAELGVDLGRARSLRPLGIGVVVERARDQVVEVDPDGPAPIRGVARRVRAVVEPIVLRERRDAVRRPQPRRVAEQLEENKVQAKALRDARKGDAAALQAKIEDIKNSLQQDDAAMDIDRPKRRAKRSRAPFKGGV